MTLLPSRPSQLTDFPFDKNLLHKTASQVNRELELSGTGLHINTRPSSLESLLGELKTVLHKIDIAGMMPGFLYRVDISSAERPGDHVPVENLVVFRCLMKVLMREKFSG